MMQSHGMRVENSLLEYLADNGQPPIITQDGENRTKQILDISTAEFTDLTGLEGIDHINHITDLILPANLEFMPENAFIACSSLRRLTLGCVNKLPKKIFVPLTQLKKLTLIYCSNETQENPDSQAAQIPTTQIHYSIHNSTEFPLINGKLKRLKIHGSAMPPLATLDKFKNLLELHLTNNSITKFSPDAFSHTPHLVVLNLNGNSKLQEIPDLSPLARLQCLYLGYCGLTKLEGNAFAQLTSLRELNLNGYKCKLAAYQLATLKALELFSIDNNKVRSLPETFFKYQKKLRSLSLKNCPLDDSQAPIIDALRSLESLNIQGTDLTTLAVQNLTQLTRLHISNNNAKYFNLQELSHLSKLQELHLKATRVSPVKEAWKLLPGLTTFLYNNHTLQKGNSSLHQKRDEPVQNPTFELDPETEESLKFIDQKKKELATKNNPSLSDKHLLFALQDLQVAFLILQYQPTNSRIALECAQQALEKALNSYVIHHRYKPDTHSIMILINEAKSKNKDFEKLLSESGYFALSIPEDPFKNKKSLFKYLLHLQYPEENKIPMTVDQSKAIVDLVRKMVVFIISKIGRSKFNTLPQQKDEQPIQTLIIELDNETEESLEFVNKKKNKLGEKKDPSLSVQYLLFALQYLQVAFLILQKQPTNCRVALVNAQLTLEKALKSYTILHNSIPNNHSIMKLLDNAKRSNDDFQILLSKTGYFASSIPEDPFKDKGSLFRYIAHLRYPEKIKISLTADQSMAIVDLARKMDVFILKRIEAEKSDAFLVAQRDKKTGT